MVFMFSCLSFFAYISTNSEYMKYIFLGESHIFSSLQSPFPCNNTVNSRWVAGLQQQLLSLYGASLSGNISLAPSDGQQKAALK
ncbi:hypothetical protein GDO78_005963 [Eleutherodactylus coqui]|uniref:Uncharacterized protein n=1 Tax=Eleutherodactylus coqui TaxID=57060 RepID=A0A8J6FM69_ELECQ|nr:hypothetical protein GDO78_005963 [Eleutherodactylus coqui]